MISYFDLKKKKGFTLIELLAVIVILAILALIAIPIVISIIKDSRKSSAKRSVDAFGRAAAAAMSNYMTKGENGDKSDYTSMLFDSNDPDYIHSWDELISKLEIKYSGTKVRCRQVCMSAGGAIGFTQCATGKDANKIVNDNDTDKMVKDADGKNFYIYMSGENTSTSTIGTWRYDTSTYLYWMNVCNEYGECYDTETTGYNVTSSWDATAVNVDSSGTAAMAASGLKCRIF